MSRSQALRRSAPCRLLRRLTLVTAAAVAAYGAACVSAPDAPPGPTPGGGFRASGWFPSDGEFDAAEQHFLKDRVAFDLGCAEVQMIKLGGKAHITQQMTTQTWGGTGCGFKASYLVECVSNWGSIACTPRLNSKEALAQTAKPAVM